MFWFFISLGFQTFVVGGEFPVEPTNMIAVVDRRVVLNCTHYDQSLVWRRRAIGNALFSNAISNVGRPHTVKAVDDDGQRRLDLVVEPVRADDAGEYRCESSSADVLVSLQLVVLGMVPNCTTEVLDDDLDLTADGHLLMKCTFNWTANFNPELPWFDPDGYIFLQTHLSAVTGQPPIKQRLLVAHLRTIDDNDDQTKLFDMSLAAERAEPGYVFNWSNANVAVLISVRNLRIRLNSARPTNCCSSSEENVLHVGDQLVCEADGPSDMKYIWEEMSPLHYMHYMAIMQRRHSLSRPGKYVCRCSASHYIRGIYFNASTQITVRVLDGFESYTTPVAAGSSSDRLSGNLYLTVGLSVTVVAVVIVLAVAFVVDRRRAKPPGRQSGTDSDDQAAQSYALRDVAAAAPEPEQSATGARRRSLPLPSIDESYVSQPTYEDMEGENQPATQECAADDLPMTTDASPTIDLVTPDEERRPSESDPDTTPKSVYESLTLELHSSEAQTASKAPNKYIRMFDVDQFSKDTPEVDLCCSDPVLLTSSADACSAQS